MLKEIIRDNLLFDESNPSMIVGDAPLEAALGRREVDVNEIRGVVQHQLLLVEAGPGPLAESMLAESLAMVRGRPAIPALKPVPWQRQPVFPPGESWTSRGC